MIVGSQLKNAQIECYTTLQIADVVEATKIKDLVVGRIIYNTDTDRLLVYDGADWQDAGYDLATLTVAGATILNGNTTIGSDSDDNVTINAKITTNLVPDDGSETIGLVGEPWDDVFTDDVTTTDISVSGTADFNGDTNIGNADSDTVTFVAKVDSSVIPSGSQKLGDTGTEWNEIHGTTIKSTTVNATTVDASGDVSGDTITANDRVVFTGQASDPSSSPSAAAGQVYYKTGEGLRLYNDGAWEDVGSGAGASSAEDTIVVFNAAGLSGDLTVNHNTDTPITTWNEVIDTTNSYSAGNFTVPATGYYDISATGYMSGDADDDAYTFSMLILKDIGEGAGAEILKRSIDMVNTANTSEGSSQLGSIVSVLAEYLVKDDVISFSTRQSNAGGEANVLNDSVLLTYCAIAKRHTASVSSGTGGKNYIANPFANNNLITGWVKYENDSAADTPEDGDSGAAGGLTFGANASSPLSGSYDFSLLKEDSTNALGQGVSYAFTVDDADKAKKFTIQFDYTTDADYEDGDVKIFVYDSGNSSLIRVNGEDLKAVSGNGTHYAQFQTASAGGGYRLCLHVATVKPADYTINFDNVSVAPQKISHGAIVTDWVSYDMTIGGHTGNPSKASSIDFDYAEWRRVGSDMEVRYTYQHSSGSGAVTGSGNLTLALPTGYSVDSTFSAADGQTGLSSIGTGFISSTDRGYQTAVIDTWTSTQVTMGYQNDRAITGTPSDTVGGSGHTHAIVEAQFSTVGLSASEFDMTNASFRISADFSVPIQGWSSNAKMSEDFSGRDVALTLEGLSTGTAVIITSGTTSDITKVSAWNTAVLDTTSSWSHDNQKWTCPETGIYDIKFNIMLDGEASTTDYQKCRAFIYKDGSSFKYFDQDQYGTQTNISSQVHHTCELAKGIEIEFYAMYSGGANIDPSNSMATSTVVTFASIAKRSSAQTILENETVACRVYLSGDQNPADNTSTPIALNTRDFDTHNAYDLSNYKYVVPITGYYQINARARYTGCLATTDYDLDLFIGATAASTSNHAGEADGDDTTVEVELGVSDIFSAVKGDEIILKAGSTTGGDGFFVDASHGYTYLSIHKIK